MIVKAEAKLSLCSQYVCVCVERE